MDCLSLQEDLTTLGQWEGDWQMKLNVAKCLWERLKQTHFDYSLHNQT